MTMICISEIKVVKADRDFLYLSKIDNVPPFAEVIGSPLHEYAEVKTEMVTGKVFVNNNGERICIGMTKQVQDLIGLPFSAFDNMAKRIDEDNATIRNLNVSVSQYKSEIDKYKTARFIDRLKYLFTKSF